jgi:signal transduction histidine kinase
MTRAVPLLVAAVTAVCVVLGIVAIATDHVRGSAPLAAVTIVSGVVCIAAGLVAGARRSERFTGALMIAAGFAVFASALLQSNRSLPFTVGLAAGAIPAALLAHLVLAFPDGRLHSPAERVLVAVAYLNATAVQIAMLMFMGSLHLGGCPCPANLLFVRDAMTLHDALMSVERAVGAAVAIGVALVLVRRWRVASAPLRRALVPILITGGITGALLALILVVAVPPYSSVPIGLQAAERLAFAAVPLAYLAGLVGTRMARVGVSDLMVELSRGVEPGRLREVLARALRDPSLELGYRIGDSDAYVDANGRHVATVATPARTVTILERHGGRVAVLVHDAALAEDPALLEAVSGAAGLALENERLLAELRAQLEEIRESRARIVDAGDAERRRLERNLHDGAQQRLVTLALHLRMAQESLDADPAGASSLLEGAGDDLKLALSELRELARGLHPAVLTDRGLAPALESLAQRAPFPVEITGVPSRRLPVAVEAAIYYVVSESLANAAKHAGASGVHVALATDADRVVVEIRDDGVGGAEIGAGSGIRGLADRVEALGGELELESPAGRGTVVRAVLPGATDTSESGTPREEHRA